MERKCVTLNTLLLGNRKCFKLREQWNLFFTVVKSIPSAKRICFRNVEQNQWSSSLQFFKNTAKVCNSWKKCCNSIWISFLQISFPPNQQNQKFHPKVQVKLLTEIGIFGDDFNLNKYRIRVSNLIWHNILFPKSEIEGISLGKLPQKKINK